MSFQLLDFAREIALPEPENFVAKCDELRLFLEETNRCVNLTRITGKEDFELKHAADSLLLTVAFPELAAKKVHIADIGCGACKIVSRTAGVEAHDDLHGHQASE